MSRISDANRQISDWRFKAKENHGYTDEQLAKKIGCCLSALTHRKTYYKLPYYQVAELERLAKEEIKK